MTSNILTIFLGIEAGATMKAEGFSHGQPIYIFLLWLVAFCFRSFGGIIYAVFPQRGGKDPYRVGRGFCRPHGREGLPKGGATG